MHEAVIQNTERRIQRTMEALRANNMEAYYVKTAAEVRPFVEQMIPEGAVVSNGGSVSLAETGVMELLASGRYQYLDRSKVTGEELDALFRQVFSADWYLASTNAVTEAGELYNVDGTANRVAAMTFGPKNVLLVVGCKTPCAVTGTCADCHSPARICCTTTIHRYQRIPGRIKVLLVGEPLGF